MTQSRYAAQTARYNRMAQRLRDKGYTTTMDNPENTSQSNERVNIHTAMNYRGLYVHVKQHPTPKGLRWDITVNKDMYQ